MNFPLYIIYDNSWAFMVICVQIFKPLSSIKNNFLRTHVIKSSDIYHLRVQKYKKKWRMKNEE